MTIHSYATRGDCNGLRAELEQGVPVDHRNESDFTSLACAASSNLAGEDAIRLLIEAGADVNLAVGNQKKTPILLAACSGSISKVKLLLSAGADINDKCRGGLTAMMLCANRGNVEMLAWLIDIGADIEAVDDSGNTALILSTQYDQTESVRLLLKAGANASHRNEYEENAMTYASNKAIQRMLEEAGEDINDLSKDAKRRILGLVDTESIDSTKAEYIAGCQPRFGTSNPEQMNVPFWDAMIRSGCNAYPKRSNAVHSGVP